MCRTGVYNVDGAAMQILERNPGVVYTECCWCTPVLLVTEQGAVLDVEGC